MDSAKSQNKGNFRKTKELRWVKLFSQKAKDASTETIMKLIRTL